MRVYIKPGVSVLKDKNSNLIHFSISTSSVHKIYEFTSEYLLFIELLKIENDVNIIFKKIQNEFPNFSKEEFLKNIEALRLDGILIYERSVPKEFNHQNSERYKRQVEFFGDINAVEINSWNFQLKLKKSTVLILGLGGLGSWIAQYLAMAGIGRLIICDFDKIEIHNLTRQALYTTQDIGRLKTDSLEQHIKLINSDVRVDKVNIKIESEEELITLTKYFKVADVIINCIDYPDINTTSSWVSKICMQLNKPHIIGGGYSGHIGLIGPTVIPYKTACWECISQKYRDDLQHDDSEILINNRKSSGAIVFLSSMIANIQSWDCINLLTGLNTPMTINRKGYLNICDFSIEWEEISRNLKCKVCGKKYE
ncbi:HesA/MoeB/ThiF family protein [Streptococcus gallolyticus]|uniref:HesA/MoeB/ThiF family protein n=1 Tax=Streptococcus gallolyticus TaxID=315405 RepID=UPI003D2FE2F0